MSDDEKIPLIIAAATAAAGERKNDAGWKARINNAIPAVAAMMSDRSRQWRIAEEVLAASVFGGTYIGYEIEESSTRAVVSIEPDVQKEEGQVETIRTHRTDGAQGKFMLTKLDELEAGQQVFAWKALEQMGDSGDRKVRVLVHLEARPTMRSASTAPRSTQPEPPPNVDADTGEIAPSADDDHARAFNELSSRFKAKVAQRLRSEGIDFPVPDPKDSNRFFTIIDEVVGA